MTDLRTYRQQYTQQQWDFIEKFPGLVFLYVAGADGNVAVKELRVFRVDWMAHISSVTFSHNELVDIFLKSVLRQSVPPKDIPTDREMEGMVKQFRSSISNRPHDEQRELKRAIAELAKAVADACGSFFGKRTSDAEQKAIDDIIGWL